MITQKPQPPQYSYTWLKCVADQVIKNSKYKYHDTCHCPAEVVITLPGVPNKPSKGLTLNLKSSLVFVPKNIWAININGIHAAMSMLHKTINRVWVLMDIYPFADEISRVLNYDTMYMINDHVYGDCVCVFNKNIIEAICCILQWCVNYTHRQLEIKPLVEVKCGDDPLLLDRAAKALKDLTTAITESDKTTAYIQANWKLNALTAYNKFTQDEPATSECFIWDDIEAFAGHAYIDAYQWDTRQGAVETVNTCDCE